MTQPVTDAPLCPSETLEGKTILLSGTTGFLGKVVLSLLLKRYPAVKTVYALIRPGVSDRARDRFNKKVATSPAMRPLVDEYGEGIAQFLEDKVVPVDGDITLENCGISDEDMAMLREAKLDVIVNSAGLVDFDPPVDEALNINALGAQNVVALAKSLDAALVHVSTCFVAGKRSGQILEDEPVFNAVPKGHEEHAEDFDHEEEIARLAKLVREVNDHAEDPVQHAHWRAEAKQHLRDEGVDDADDKLLRAEIGKRRKRWIDAELRRVGMERSQFWGWTNTYTFTKSLGEQVIAKAAQDGLEAAILRPSIVESAREFPFPGWNEGLTTSAPLILLSRHGLPEFPFGEDLVLDVIPVDMVAGAIIAVTAAVLAGPHKFVFQASTGDVNPLTIKQAVELTGFAARKYNRQKGKKGVMGWFGRNHEMRPVPKDKFRRRSVPQYKKVAAKVLNTVDNVGPDRLGWMRDAASIVRDVAAGVEKSSRRIEKVLEMFMPFIADNRYVFRSDNTRYLMSRIPDAERADLCYDPEGYVWREYWQNIHVPGLERWVFPQLEAELAEKPKQKYTYRDLLELFESATHKYRHQVAFQYLRKSADEHVTYGELRTLARRVAAYLVDQGVEPNDRVLLVAENRPEWVAAYFGILSAGATAVPVDAMAKAEEIINIAKASGAKGAILSPRTGRRLIFEGATPDQIASSGAALWLLSELVTYSKELESSREAAKLASIIFTSGTTGKPKGVMLSQKNFTFEVSRLSGVFDLGSKDHLLSVLPLHHTFEFTAGLLMPLSRGAQISYVSMITGPVLSRALNQGVTGLIGVPALWQLLQRRMEQQITDSGTLPNLIVQGTKAMSGFLREYFDFNAGPLLNYPVHRALGGRLRYLVSGGSALNPEVHDFFTSLGFNLTEGYGLTETAPVLTVGNPKKRGKAGSVGKPLPGVEIKIDQPNEEGIGEVLARGPNVMQGYFGDEEATAAVMDNGWFRTGDLGRLDKKGMLFLAGRKKDVIVDADGRNVYPDELEDAYGDHPSVKELSVVGLMQPSGTERVACIVVPEYGEEKDMDDVHAHREDVRDTVRRHMRHVSDSLPYYKRVKTIQLWDGELPRTATRKVKRQEVITILERILDTGDRVEKLAKTSTPAASSSLDLVRRVVAALAGKGVDAIQADTRLASDLGFDSLMFVELAGALEPYSKGDVSTEQLMGIETVADIIPLLGSRAGQGGLIAASGNAEIVGLKEASVDPDEEKYPVPAPLKSAGKGLLTWAQRSFYKKVMDVDVRGQEHIPKHTAFLIAANHTSHLDAGLVKIALGEYGRKMVSLAAKDYFFDTKFKRTYFENFTNLAPIERHGALKQSLRRALSTLESNRSLLIFPEGTRSPDGTLMPFKASLGYLAITSGAPVLPMYLWGTYRAMPKGSTLFPSSRKIGVVIGPCITAEDLKDVTQGLPKSEAYRVATEIIERAVTALRDEGRYRPSDLFDEMRKQLEQSGSRQRRLDAPAETAASAEATENEPTVSVKKANGAKTNGAKSNGAKKKSSNGAKKNGKSASKKASKSKTKGRKSRAKRGEVQA